MCIGLAYACRRLSDVPPRSRRVDKALALKPRNVRALILKADLLAELGDDRSASSFYQFAIRIAPPANEMPADLRDEVARAQAMCDRYAGQFEAFLQDRLGVSGLPDGRAATRFRHSLDILLGRKKIYHPAAQDVSTSQSSRRSSSTTRTSSPGSTGSKPRRRTSAPN